MSRTQRFRPTGVVVAAGALLGAVALAGCGAGQITQTDAQVPAVVGASGTVGTVAVRDAHIEFGEQAQGANIYPRGGAAPIRMSIVNSGTQPDRLVSATSPAAASVAISGESDVPPGRVLVIAGGAEAAPAPTGSARSTPGATAGSTAGATPSAAAPGGEQAGPSGEAAEPSGEAAPTAGGAAPTAEAAPPTFAGNRAGHVVLTGLTEDVRAGLTYPLVLNFERAGQVTLSVPVGYPSEPREDEPAE